MSCVESGTLMVGPTQAGGSGEGDSNPCRFLRKCRLKGGYCSSAALRQPSVVLRICVDVLRSVTVLADPNPSNCKSQWLRQSVFRHTLSGCAGYGRAVTGGPGGILNTQMA